MKFKLPDSVATSQDLSALQLELHDYAKWYAHESIKKRVDAKKGSAMPTLSPAALETVRLWHKGATLTPRSLDELMTTLEHCRQKSPVITITLASPPPPPLKATLVAWCREHIAADILVNFQFNATLLGGMVIRHGSRVFDWSFRRQILAARSNFPEVLRRV